MKKLIKELVIFIRLLFGEKIILDNKIVLRKLSVFYYDELNRYNKDYILDVEYFRIFGKKIINIISNRPDILENDFGELCDFFKKDDDFSNVILNNKQLSLWEKKDDDFFINHLYDYYNEAPMIYNTISEISIDNDTRILNIKTSRPGLIIGKAGVEIEKLKKSIQFLTDLNTINLIENRLWSDNYYKD